MDEEIDKLAQLRKKIAKLREQGVSDEELKEKGMFIPRAQEEETSSFSPPSDDFLSYQEYKPSGFE